MNLFEQQLTVSMLEEIAAKTDPLTLNAWLESIEDLEDEDFISHVSSRLVDVRQGRPTTINRSQRRKVLKTLKQAGKKSGLGS